jgi:serine/threonine protein kinase
LTIMPKTESRQRLNGRYVLLDRIAVGGTAEVWRGRDEKLDRPVAVKMLHAHLLPDETSRRRLAAEARTAASLSHPGIVEVYEVRPDDESPALVMELVDGESLADRLARDGKLPPHEAAGIAADVAEALYHAHRRGIVHRDVKPSNVLLDSRGRARLVDFGIAHSLAEAAERLTQTGTVVGTMRYMAPEQLSDGEIGPRTDLYGLGAVMHEMLTGRPPYEASTPVAMAEAQAAGPPELPDVDPALATIVLACLASTAAERPRHAGFVAQVLRAWLRGDPMPALPAAAVATDAVTQQIPIPLPAQSPAPAATRPNRRLLVAIGGVILLGVLVAAVSLGGLALSTAGPITPTATPLPTVKPVPAWLTQLRADYADACGESLDMTNLRGLDREELTDRVDELIKACTEPDEGKGNGGGHGHGGHGKD